MLNWKMIYRVLGFLLFIETVLLLICTVISYHFREDDLNDFIITALLTAIAGGIFSYLGKGAERNIQRRDGYIIVTSAWIIFTLFGMLPFYFSGYIPTITNAFFETMSGFTTTGATILDDIESLPHGLLFWRSMTQWIGGLGIIFFTIAVLPFLGTSGIQLFAAESSGPSQDKVHPRIEITAKWLWTIYLTLTILAAFLLHLGGMNLFDSICHSLTTNATGGYSTKQAGIAYYNSPYIEYVITFFMALSGVNFTLLLFLLKGRVKKVVKNAELRWYLTSVLCFTLLIALILYASSNLDPEKAFRRAIFQVVSLHTSTGYSTADYMTWAPVTWGLLSIIMISGACAGSTSGGMKCIRLLILTKIARNEFKRIIHPNAVLPARVNDQVLPDRIKSTVLAFSFIYTCILILGWLLMMAFGVGFMESFGVIISSIGNIGIALGLFGPEYSWNSLPELAKWLSSFLMIIGRLELFTILLLFSPGFWRKN
ncbi:MAG: TrkH family potassium uptake protein [Bacteroides sp.]|nr:TrkH family potassium uptake protein [Bacteroides sp.]